MFPYSYNNELNTLMYSPFLDLFESDEDFINPLSERELESKEKFKLLQSDLNYKNILPDNIIALDEKTTANQTNNQELFWNQFQKEADCFKGFYTYDKIYQLFESHKIDQLLLSKFNKDFKIEEAENYMKLIKKKRKRKKNKKDEKQIFVYNEKFRMGRKILNDQSKRNHTKFSSDNIIKKIKTKLFENLILFVNNMLKNKYKIKDLNYTIIDRIKKDIDLELLEMPIKDLLSKNISPKYSNFPSDSNKKCIEAILDKEKDNKPLIFILNKTFKDWIEIYTLKKNVKDFENLNEENSLEIEENLPKIQVLMENILKDYDEEYFSIFIFYLYNYERWFTIKRNRKEKRKE